MRTLRSCDMEEILDGKMVRLVFRTLRRAGFEIRHPARRIITQTGSRQSPAIGSDDASRSQIAAPNSSRIRFRLESISVIAYIRG